MESAISIKGLQKRYGDFEIKDLNLEVPIGSIVGLIGDNGAGKTTTLRLILNMAKRDGGEIQVLGMDNLAREREIKEQVGVVFDECSFHDTLRAGDVGTILRAIYADWDDERYTGYLRRFHLPTKKTIKEYSRGMRMKLSIAAALAHAPRLLLLDEATGGLDPVMRDEMLELFMEFMQDEEHTILMSSHITGDLEKICDYICFLHNGEILLFEQKDVLLEQYGMLRCGAYQLEQFGKAEIRRVKHGAFGCEALITNREQARQEYPDAVIDRVSLEDIMVLFLKGERVA